jgi:ankyrin repeat protein
LIKKGANIEAQNKQKATPLHIASYFAKEEVVKILLQYKANKDAINQNNEKPLDVAREELKNSSERLKPNYNKIIQLLT